MNFMSMEYFEKPKSDSPVNREDLARPYKYQAGPKEVRLDMIAYAGPGVVGFMRPGEDFIALDFEGRIPYGHMGQGARAVREHEMMHHAFHNGGHEQDERRINRLVANNLGLYSFPFASY